MASSSQQATRVSAANLHTFARDVLRAAGANDEAVEHVSAGLLHASRRGVDSHGIRLLTHYVRALKAGRINPDPRMKFQRTSPSTGVLDADDGFGMAATMVAAGHAVALAREAGTGQVSVKNSSHFGAASFFALEIARHDMLGMAFTHSDALLLTHGGTGAFLGNNPIAFAAPMDGEEPLCLDMATSAMTFNKVLQCREANVPAPAGGGADATGRPATDPHQIVSLIPTGTYKGYGLSLMVEVLCGLLSGMPCGRDIPSMYKAPIHEKRHLAHFVSATRLDCFQEPAAFKARLAALVRDLRAEPRFDPAIPVQVAGDPEKRCQAERDREGIPVPPEVRKALGETARNLGVTPPWKD